MEANDWFPWFDWHLALTCKLFMYSTHLAACMLRAEAAAPHLKEWSDELACDAAPRNGIWYRLRAG
jgi:hypothetical protein